MKIKLDDWSQYAISITADTLTHRYKDRSTDGYKQRV